MVAPYAICHEILAWKVDRNFKRISIPCMDYLFNIEGDGQIPISRSYSC